jgi:hypothetical protein
MDGILYLHNLAGQALSQANAKVEELTAEVRRLTAENEALRKAEPATAD